MSHNDIIVTFLGTTSGGGPTETRNCSSLVIEPLGHGSLWMVDCAEGTVRQFAQQPQAGFSRLRINSVNKIFITHMHADHTMGLITLLRNILGIAPDPPISSGGAGTGSTSVQTSRTPALKVEIFGPVGLRAFIRTVLTLTHTRSADCYCVHELLMAGETPSAPCDVTEGLHSSEQAGRDIDCSQDGFWKEIASSNTIGGAHIVVHAGPIIHRDPCIGYILNEYRREPRAEQVMSSSSSQRPALRTIVILGDTSDPSALVPLVTQEPGRTVSLLVHEATDAYIPPHIDSRGTTGRNRSHEIVRAKAVNKGHSTPAMAGAFARLIGAERLALNHIGARFPAPPFRAGPSNFRLACMREIEDQALREWKPTNGNRVMAVVDFDRIVIPPNTAMTPPDLELSGETLSSDQSTRIPAVDSTPILESGQTTLHRAAGHLSETRPSRGRGRGTSHHGFSYQLLTRGYSRFSADNHSWRGRGQASAATAGRPAPSSSSQKRGNSDENERRHRKSRREPYDPRDKKEHFRHRE